MLKFDATVKTANGKGVSRRLRHAGQVPAIVYGLNKEPVAIILDHDKVNNVCRKPEFLDVITLVIDGVEEKVRVCAIQEHPVKPKLLHLDFLRVEA